MTADAETLKLSANQAALAIQSQLDTMNAQFIESAGALRAKKSLLVSPKKMKDTHAELKNWNSIGRQLQSKCFIYMLNMLRSRRVTGFLMERLRLAEAQQQ